MTKVEKGVKYNPAQKERRKQSGKVQPEGEPMTTERAIEGSRKSLKRARKRPLTREVNGSKIKLSEVKRDEFAKAIR